MQYYLKCTNCSHLNLLKTQYLVFCEKCNLKLKNNFSDWEKIHPDKNYNFFLENYALSQTDVDDDNEKSEADKDYYSKRKKIVLVLITLFIVIVSIVIYLYIEYLR